MKDDIYGTFKKRNADSTYDGANRNVKKEDWASGHWENLPDAQGRPTYIQNKSHLRAECTRRGVMAKGLLKSASQGRGYEMSKSTNKVYI